MASVPKPVYSVQVRELIEFALRRGDLGGERLFVASDRALAGTRGHQRVQKSRPPHYQKEVPICFVIETDELILRIQGRIDGLLVEPQETLLEEIKGGGGGGGGRADPLHWAQAKLYAYVYGHEHGLETIAIQLTYLHLETGALTEFRERFAQNALAASFEEATAIYLEWIVERHRWCQRRDESIRALDFPFAGYRAGQRKLAVAAYRTLSAGGRLFIEAPTGIGKTSSVLFPALKALGEGKLERIFYLTARTVGRAVAESTLENMRQGGLRLHSLTLTAKEKLCVREGVACDPNTCRLAMGYYDRRKAAMREALARESITRPVLEEVGRAHQVCPFELSLDLSTWVDAVICDYNYVFDPKVYLRRHFAEQSRAYAFLVDEGHNLPDRAREMFSSELDGRQIRETARAIKGALPACARALTRLGSAMRKLCGSSQESEPDHQEFSNKADLFSEAALVRRNGLHRNRDVVTIKEFPESLRPLVQRAIQEAENWLAQNGSTEFREALLQLFFRLHSFNRTAELYDDQFVTIIDGRDSVLVRLFCLDPSLLLRQALERGKAAIFFSATLTPIEYYQALISGCPEDPLLRLPSPFPPEHMQVLVQDRIRTDFKTRDKTISEVAEAIGALVEGRPGNYLVYFPSYQYLQSVRDEFTRMFPSVQVLAQRPEMNERDRESFLAAFSEERRTTLAGFAVMGGIFGEGIDLVGERLIGAAIVGVGLPQLCTERDLILDYFQEKTGAGFDFAYTFPGMNRVLQATGRVIRSETDRGVVLLLDTRFAEPRYRRLFPAHWQSLRVRTPAEIRDRLRGFWGEETQNTSAVSLDHIPLTPPQRQQ